jgi:hypothetical protein
VSEFIHCRWLEKDYYRAEKRKLKTNERRIEKSLKTRPRLSKTFIRHRDVHFFSYLTLPYSISEHFEEMKTFENIVNWMCASTAATKQLKPSFNRLNFIQVDQIFYAGVADETRRDVKSEEVIKFKLKKVLK